MPRLITIQDSGKETWSSCMAEHSLFSSKFRDTLIFADNHLLRMESTWIGLAQMLQKELDIE